MHIFKEVECIIKNNHAKRTMIIGGGVAGKILINEIVNVQQSPYEGDKLVRIIFLNSEHRKAVQDRADNTRYPLHFRKKTANL